jgi:hypothetical protein
MAKLRYVPKTKKDKLINEIMSLQQSYIFGDNAERLYQMDEDELFDELCDVKSMILEAKHNSI